MRATDIIRGFLDLVDGVENLQQPESSCGCDQDCGCEHSDSTTMAVATTSDELRRFQQILDLTSSGAEQYSNSPDEKTSSIDSVTVDAGGGANEPKHVADIRGEHGRLYGGN